VTQWYDLNKKFVTTLVITIIIYHYARNAIAFSPTVPKRGKSSTTSTCGYGLSGLHQKVYLVMCDDDIHWKHLSAAGSGTKQAQNWIHATENPVGQHQCLQEE
jgi:hypothetical protein